MLVTKNEVRKGWREYLKELMEMMVKETSIGTVRLEMRENNRYMGKDGITNLEVRREIKLLTLLPDLT